LITVWDLRGSLSTPENRFGFMSRIDCRHEAEPGLLVPFQP